METRGVDAPRQLVFELFLLRDAKDRIAVLVASVALFAAFSMVQWTSVWKPAAHGRSWQSYPVLAAIPATAAFWIWYRILLLLDRHLYGQD